MKDDLGDRMKQFYENSERRFLTRRMPTIIRIDGKAFHSFTKGFAKPFDDIMKASMQATAKYLCENIQGCKLAYTQSDEITLLLTDYDKITSDSWFGKNLQKMVSISASMATLAFNKFFSEQVGYMNSIPPKITNSYAIKVSEKEVYEKKKNTALFDSRVFNIPKEEVVNCFIWRQQDATRNAIQSIGQANFSHNELKGKKTNEIQDMLWLKKGINFSWFNTCDKRGVCVVKEVYKLPIGCTQATRSYWEVDQEIPIFTEDRNYIERFV